MELKNVVPWGRSFSEYQKMFGLTGDDLKKSILGCGDGPASFNAELTRLGGKVTSVDPTYTFTAAQLKSRIAEVYKEIMPQMEQNKAHYIWDTICSVSNLADVRMSAMSTFLADFEEGKKDHRYIEASLPSLPFAPQQFDLALCSHYLFLYSAQVDLPQHIQSMLELTRVAREVRVYPLVNLQGEPSPHLEPVIEELEKKGLQCDLIDSEYRFQKGATKTLSVKQSGSIQPSQPSPLSSTP